MQTSARHDRYHRLAAAIFFFALSFLAGCQQLPESERATTPAATRESTDNQATSSTEEVVGATALSSGTAVAEATSAAPATPTSPATRRAGEAASAATPAREGISTTETPGALISLSLSSRAGILLDEIPSDMRERVVADLSDRPDTYWQSIAREQVGLTYNRLHFRPFFYGQQKGQLPLPPATLWQIGLTSEPYRETIEGHDLLLVDYDFSSTLLTDQNSPAAAEPALAEVEGIWQEPFILPADPTQLLQRTSNACINEGGFPPDSFDSENVFLFYDYTCTPTSTGPAGCHRTQRPSQSCQEALLARVGSVTTSLNFERLPWEASLADDVRVGQVFDATAPDLQVVGEDLDNNRVVYRYFPTDSCALQEQCVDAGGWRRLLLFDATAHNQGAAPLVIGRTIAENPLNNMFQYNACHDHFHFANYGEFELGANNQPSKQAFCVESTSRFSNNELSPLTHDYTCLNQGIQAGWVDEYKSGLDCQWIDITDFPYEEGETTVPLTFRFNQDQFLCEGVPILNEDGALMWEPTGERDDSGFPLSRPQCDFVAGWEDGNEATTQVSLQETGSFVTAPCAGAVLGPLRNCGFSEQPLSPLPEPEPNAEGETAGPSLRCQPGQPVQLSCDVADAAAPQVLRVCDASAELGTGTACTFSDALANRTVTSDGRDITFTCPFQRSDSEPGGDFSFYVAPVYPDDDAATVSCSLTREGG